MSQVHFGHYMARTFNPTIVVMNAKMEEMSLTTGKRDSILCYKNSQET